MTVNVQTKKPDNYNVLMFGVCIVAIIIFLLGFWWWNSTQSTGDISGTVKITGVLPAETVQGDIIIEATSHDKEDLIQVEKLNMRGDLNWDWNDAKHGENYAIFAKLVIDGDEITRSDPIDVSAPASDEELFLGINLENLPESLHTGALSRDEEFVDIGGLLNIHGYVPLDSYVKVFTMAPDGIYQDIGEKFSTENNTEWKWDSAEPGIKYTIIAQLLDSEERIIGESPSVNVSAPASGQNLLIESHAHHAHDENGNPQKATVSGKINLNGPIDNNSSIKVMHRLPGEADFKLADEVNSRDNVKWEWKGAQSGQRYEMFACYALSGVCQSMSYHKFVNAPAQFADFTINTKLSLHEPTGKPELKDCTKNKNNYTARIDIPLEKAAQSYFVQVGKQSGGHDVYNHKISSTSSFSIYIDVDTGKTYNAHYAWGRNNTSYSHFSTNTQFSCGGINNPITPNPTPPIKVGSMGYIWDSSKRTCAATTNKNAVYAYTSAGLAQCKKANGVNVPITNPSPSQPPVTKPINLLKDPDMEAGNTSSWIKMLAAVITKEPGARTGGSGSQVLRIAASTKGVGYGGSNTQVNPVVVQSIAKQGVHYKLTGYARGDGTSQPRFFVGQTEWLGTTSKSWQRIDFEFYGAGTLVGFATNINKNLIGVPLQYSEWDDLSIVEITP